MRKITITTDPLDLVGEQFVRDVTGGDNEKIRASTLIGYTIIGVEEGRCGEVVLVLQKPHTTFARDDH